MMCLYPIVRQLALEWMGGMIENVAIAATIASWFATFVTFPLQKWRITLQSGEQIDMTKLQGTLSSLYKGLGFKLLDTTSKTFLLFLVKEQSDIMLCILDG